MRNMAREKHMIYPHLLEQKGGDGGASCATRRKGESGEREYRDWGGVLGARSWELEPPLHLISVYFLADLSTVQRVIIAASGAEGWTRRERCVRREMENGKWSEFYLCTIIYTSMHAMNTYIHDEGEQKTSLHHLFLYFSSPRNTWRLFSCSCSDRSELAAIQHITMLNKSHLHLHHLNHLTAFVSRTSPHTSAPDRPPGTRSSFRSPCRSRSPFASP